MSATSPVPEQEETIELRCSSCGAAFRARKPTSASSVVPSWCPACGRLAVPLSEPLTPSQKTGPIEESWLELATAFEGRLEAAEPDRPPEPREGKPPPSAPRITRTLATRSTFRTPEPPPPVPESGRRATLPWPPLEPPPERVAPPAAPPVPAPAAACPSPAPPVLAPESIAAPRQPESVPMPRITGRLRVVSPDEAESSRSGARLSPRSLVPLVIGMFLLAGVVYGAKRWVRRHRSMPAALAAQHPPAPVSAQPAAVPPSPSPAAPPAPEAPVRPERSEAEPKGEQNEPAEDPPRPGKPNDIRTLLEEARQALRTEHYMQAAEGFQKVLDRRPQHPGALRGMADTYRIRGEREQALKYYRLYMDAPTSPNKKAVAKLIERLKGAPKDQ